MLRQGRSARALRFGSLGLLTDLLAVLGSAVYGSRLSDGMDVNWDQLSYHSYYSWLFLHGDLRQADPEPFANRYLNPLAQLPWYLVDQAASPRGTAFIVAAIAGVNLILIRRIMLVVLDSSGVTRGRDTLAFAAVCLAAVGTTYQMSLGTSLSDVILSIPVLAAVFALIRSVRAESLRAERMWLLTSGLLAGAALGLKLTLAPMVIGLAVATAVQSVILRTPRPLTFVGLSGVLGVGLSGGWWFYRVWLVTGNPVYPYFNSVFKSPLWGDYNLRDDRFGATSLLDFLRFPYYMMEGGRRLLDYYIRDVRWVVLLGLLFLGIGVLLLRARRSGSGLSAPSPIVVLLVFFVSAGTVWAFQFGIARYAQSLELLSGVVLALLFLGILRRPGLSASVGVAAALIMAPLDIGHVEHVPYASDRYGIQSDALYDIPSGAVVLHYSGPSGFMLAKLKPGVRRHIIQPWFYGSPMLEKLKRDEIAPAKEIYVLARHDWERAQARTQEFERAVGVRLIAGSCVTIKSNVADRDLCRATWVGQ